MGVHPAGVAFHRSPPKRRSEQAALPQWFMYKEMVLSSQMFIRECSAITPEQVMLFGGTKLTPVDAADAAAAVEGKDGDAGKGDAGLPPLLGADGLPAGAAESGTLSLPDGNMPKAVIDDWILAQISCADTAELLIDVRKELEAALAHKAMTPRRGLTQVGAVVLGRALPPRAASLQAQLTQSRVLF